MLAVNTVAAALATPQVARGDDQAAVVTPMPCAARAIQAGNLPITWHAGPVDDRESLDQWCRAVGPPVVIAAPEASDGALPPALEELVVLTWNAHLAEGDLRGLIENLRAGELTGGRPVQHFVLLLQELYRRGPDVPAFGPDTRSAFAILPRDPRASDVRDHAHALGLSTLYVPSMRNGEGMLEDRGNAIISTEPLVDAFALELPFERQRRVVVGAAIQVRASGSLRRLHVVDTHLEPLSSPASLWIFRNPRRRQVAAILELLQSSHFENDGQAVGTVLGGDFNTIQGGMDEDAYLRARAWSQSLVSEDRRPTHHMGRIDYLFFRLAPDWIAASTRVEEKFGSDHHPVVGRFFSRSRTP